jgi:HlyD family secretion protein
MKKALVGTAVAAILICVSGYFLVNRAPRSTASPQVQAVQVKKGSIEMKVSGSGTVRPVEEATIKASESGKVLRIGGKEGERVKQGDLLVEFDSVDKSSEIRQEELTIQKTQIQLEEAQKELMEQTADGVSDTLKNNVRKLQIDIQLSQERINNYMKLADAPDPVTATINGELTEFNPVQGDQLTAGATIAKMVNYDLLEVAVEVDELDVPKLKTGMKAALTFDAIPNQTYEGEVYKISNQGKADNGVSVYEVTIRFSSIEGARSGMSAQATILANEKKDALLLPIEAVEESGGIKKVTIPSGNSGSASGTAVEIHTGLYNETHIEITDGLQEGDTVILPIAENEKKSSNPASMPGAVGF